ncbi:MAG: hypothetical protein ACTSWC_02640 [Promethearchaeota archaeon]
MPRGIVIIDWDAFEGGIISFKYPETLDVPTNLVQLLQISHTFSEGLLTIKDGLFHAVSIGNEPLQKVIVLILSEFEDENDFFDIVNTMNSVVTDVQDDKQLQNQLVRVFQLSQSVFKARDAVLTKLAEEITELKNKEIDIRQSLEWLIRHEESIERSIIFLLMRYGPLDPGHLLPYLNKYQLQLRQQKDAILKKNISLRKGKPSTSFSPTSASTISNSPASISATIQKEASINYKRRANSSRGTPLEIEFHPPAPISMKELDETLKKMTEDNIIKQDLEGRCHLLIHYGFD